MVVVAFFMVVVARPSFGNRKPRASPWADGTSLSGSKTFLDFNPQHGFNPKRTVRPIRSRSAATTRAIRLETIASREILPPTTLPSSVIRLLSHDIVKRASTHTDSRATAWVAVTLDDGLNGYVASGDVRSPVDYRACFTRIEGVWKLTAFVAGD